MIYKNILETVGNTPIIKLNKIVPEDCADVLVKFEGLNAGGSIKTRTALRMIEKAEEEGLLNKNSVIVEPTSGNQGIGLALVGAVKGYKVRIIMPDSVSIERRKLITHYGAELILIHDDGDIGECIRKCIKMAQDMMRKDKNIFLPQQFDNEENLNAHLYQTGKEIIDAAGKNIDGFCSGIGTGGTISGVGKALRDANPDIEIWALEPENAAILSHKKVTSHLQMGIGDGLIPPILNQEIYDDILIVSDEDAIETSRKLACLEGINCGISSGTNVYGAIQLAKKLGKGKTVVTILADTGERYISTPLYR
jgi:cysteine synthase